MKRFFRPAIQLMNRLSYPKKMALVVLIFSVPLTIFLSMLISETKRGIDLAKKEILGVEYNKTVVRLVRDLQQHRGMVNAFLRGDVIFEDKLTAKAVHVEDDIKAIDRGDERFGALFGTRERWGELKRKWKGLRETYMNMEAAESFGQHTALVAESRSLMTHVADMSSLMLDPALDIFYLMDSMVNTIPGATEFEGQIRGFGAGAIVSRSLLPQERAKLIVLSGLCRSTLDELEINMRKVFVEKPFIRADLDEYLKEAISSGERALEILDRDVIFAQSISIEPLEYFEIFTEAIDKSFSLHVAVTTSLEKLLNERIRDLKSKRFFLLAGALAGFLLIVYLFTGHYHSIMNALDQLVHASEHIGRGDMDLHVSLDTKDEMARVAKSFNDMALSLASHTDELKRVNVELQREVVERMQAEEKIRESEKKYRLLVDNALVGVYRSTLEGKFLYVNDAFVRMAGFDSIEEMLSENIESRYRDPDRRQILIDELKGKGRVDNFEIAMLTKKGKTKNIIVNVVLEGEVLSGMVLDITERKKAENALRESEEQYRVMTETASDAIVTIDDDSRIIFCNKSCEKLFGYEMHELVGKFLTMLMPKRFRDRHLSAFKRYLETGTRTINWKAIEVPGLHKSGREIPLEIAYGEFTVDGQHYFTGFLRDITERKEAEKEKEYKNSLETFNRELEILVAERTMSLMALRLADSVRNPSTVIGWLGRKLLDNEGIPDKLKNSLNTIIDEARKLEDTVQEFQSLMESMRAVFKYEDLNEIVGSVLFVIEREAADKKVNLVKDLAEKPLKLNAQKDLLKMAVFNMLRNAIEVTREGGSVSISTAGDMNEIFFTVSDSGPGIPEEAIDKIFDIAYSAKIYRFGMGMPLIKQIVAEHLGEITVQTEAGKGTTFRVVFPARWIKKA
ncbi:MAG: PAS domain S-box protein [Thermodesulfovibrionales bacterium]